MKGHWLIASAFAALLSIVDPSVSARTADPDPLPRDRFFFTYNYYDQALGTPDQIRLRESFSQGDSTGILAANSMLFFVELLTGRTFSPFAAYSPAERVPINLAGGTWNDRLVAIASPAAASANNPRVIALGPPQQLLGELRLPGTSEAEAWLAFGNFLGDNRPEVAFTTGAGPTTRVTFGTLGLDTWITFLPGGELYAGGAMLAGGPLRNNGYDQLAVSMTGGRVDIFDLREDVIERIGTGVPIGGFNGIPGIDVFDVNNDGRWELLVSDTGKITAVDLNNGGTPLVHWRLEPFPNQINPEAIRFNAGVSNRLLAIGAVRGPRLSIWTHDPDARTFRESHASFPFGTGVERVSFSSIDRFIDSVLGPNARK
jgi:hypothetical protein